MTTIPPRKPTSSSGSNGADRPSESSNLFQAVGEGSKALADFGKTALEGLKGPERIAVYAIGAVAIVALLVAAVKAAVWVVITVAASAVVLLLLVRGSKSAALPTWSCAVPRLPLANPDLQTLSDLLEELRQQAYAFLHAEDRAPTLEERYVRANVFLADYRDPGDGYAFNLYMPDELRRNMNHPAEWELRFRPGQGATGLTFVSGSQRVTHRQPDEAGEWESRFELSDDQKRCVHRDLKWIVSLPLKDMNNSATLGVLNIDGLNHDVSDDHLSSMAAALIPQITAAAVVLTKQSKVTIGIYTNQVDG